MSDFGKNGVEKSMQSAAKVAVNRFMEQQSAENLQKLRMELSQQNAHKDSGAHI